ncbi:MAG: GNAT family protein [Clostridia bacterium]
MQTLITDNLILRDFSLGDACDVYEYAQLDCVGSRAGWKPHKSLDESLAIVKNFILEQEVWAICLKQTGKVIGSVGLHKVNRDTGDYKVCYMGYVLNPCYWGKGYATQAGKAVQEYAFKIAKVNMLSVTHFEPNIQSKRVIQKLQFNFEAKLRNYGLYEGKLCNHCIYSLTKEEFFALN